ncbi:LuxR C-terminal-related transcriptional regulator [Cohnella sp. GCM10027633]|uniref:LuxR C-terminal-related transcriptional regulator n=1 Tax=unclassified Cohnella TaxID=2636738 RepID=UPI00362FE15F
MNRPILSTKLYIPSPRKAAVPRPRLVDRMNEGLRMDRKLTLISASAGFGKTTLVGQWVAGCGRPVAWLSLDEGDNDAARFLAHLTAAFRTIADTIGSEAVRMLDSSQPPAVEMILTLLINEIAALPSSLLLVLDDYHVIDADGIDEALGFLLEHLPNNLHLVVASRDDPRLPLGRLRGRGLLTELRTVDLRFTSAETEDFFNRGMGLSLTAEDAAVLESRTEGWITGLQLAGLSLRSREDIPGYIRAFAGDDRYVVDYLAEEVLRRLTEPERDFLLQTSILERLNGPLCDAVTGGEDGQQRLEALERGNFFVVPLDNRRGWYRYHHLFAEVLAVHLKADRPGWMASLHRRASEWFERNGTAADAIRHALAAEDYERAAAMIELVCPEMSRLRQEATMLGWLNALPDGHIRRRPVLGVWFAGALLTAGKPEGVEDRLRDAERWLGTSEPRERANDTSIGMAVADEEQFRRLPASIAMYRAGLALARGDAAAAMPYARLVLERAPEEDRYSRGAAAGLLGLASWTLGDIETAYRTFANGMDSLRLAGNISDAIGGSIALADIRISQGRIREAMEIYEQGLRLAREQGEPAMRGTADMYAGMSELRREQDDLPAAMQLLSRSRSQGEHTGFPQYRYRWRVAMARLQAAQGNPDDAIALLDEAEECYAGDLFPNVRPIAAMRARIHIATGRLGEAIEWARSQGLSARDELGYLREFEHITLARLLLARYENERDERFLREAKGLLARLLQSADDGGRAGSALDILIAQALACRMQGDAVSALVPLERALTLSEPEGYVRIYADEGLPMAALLEAAATRGIARPYVRRLQAAFIHIRGPAPAKPAAGNPIIEPLSEREREVLRLLRTDRSGPDIARELMVSLNTVRTHTQHIYDKLAVNNRRAAVRRSEELGLF